MRRWVSRCELCGMGWLPTSTFMIKMSGTPVVIHETSSAGGTQTGAVSVVTELYNLARQAKPHSLGARCHWHWSSSWERLRVFVRFRIWFPFVFPSDSSMPLRGSQRRYFPRPLVVWGSSDSMAGNAKPPFNKLVKLLFVLVTDLLYKTTNIWKILLVLVAHRYRFCLTSRKWWVRSPTFAFDDLCYLSIKQDPSLQDRVSSIGFCQ